MGYYPPFYYDTYQTEDVEMSFDGGRHQRQYADRVRQRQCRARKKRRIDDLEDEIQTLRARLTQVEEERNTLQAIVDENGGGSILRDGGTWAAQAPDEGVSSINTQQPYTTFSKSCGSGVEILVRQGEERTNTPLSQQSSRLEESLALTLPMQPPRGILLPAWTRLPPSTPTSCPLDTVLAELEIIGRRAEAKNLRIPEFI
ncbi:uncharacterized protein PV07_05540 [Cladophialophora immunda]|uniref:BZIP domain-containing protein n=1 Tax=Cladophialophora immunda TaxID=569365 RepID=A0A0D1ZP20_9EURO|nr:uncharacterized protein PV07_05540 [Cladophialophora immunda]KIW29751.1 hypothetical protein PV07_05540 [Cladophialophora immunda]